MSPIACACAGSVTDMFAGFPLPKDIILNAIVISKRPTADGRGFELADIVSEMPTPVRFVQARRVLRNVDRVHLVLRKEVWSPLYLMLLHEDGAPFAKGSMSLGPLATGQVLEASPDLIAISSRSMH